MITTPVSECLYCQNNERLDSLMIKICDLEVSQLFLFKEQTYHGRCNVVYKDHAKDIQDLDEQQLNAFMKDVASVGKVIAEIYNPSKLNYGTYGDVVTHLHIHVVPKYEDGYGFGTTFEMNPEKTYLSDAGYTEMIAGIKKALNR